ncbi:MAG: MFS transporter [Actinobacteria bacterium]|nr:MFS transporter [Actinomycetota bacterium]
MRRLLLLVCVVVCVDTMLYAALTPLLPHFAHELGLSKARAGVLVAAYAGGALVGGIPGGIAAARLGARRSVLLGLALMGCASLGFAFAGGFWGLVAARLLQGGGSAFTWAGAFAWLLAAAPRERRGQLIGTAMGSAVFGALLGPVVGAAAALAGQRVVFAALAGLAVVLGAWALRLDDAPRAAASPTALGRALRSPVLLSGLALMSLPALLFGVLSTLGPLHLSASGWTAAEIGGIWLVSAAIETAVSPLAGRVSDRRGAFVPVRIALVAGVLVSLALAAGPRPLLYAPLIVLAGGAYGTLFTPAFTLIADGADHAGMPQGMAFGLMNAAWATGALVGPAAGGAIAAASGDVVPYVVAAGLCAVSLALARSRHDRAAVLVDGLPRDAAGVGRE